MNVKIAFPTDEHHPYQDDAAIEVALRIVEDFNPDEIVVGSDGIDFYNISKFSKDPLRVKGANLQAEINSWKATQRKWMDAAPNARRRYIPGNHEDRLRRYIWDHPELHGLDALELPNLLGFDELNIEKIEDEIVYDDRLLITHGEVVRQYSAYSAKGELDRQFHSISVLTGHTHRGGTHYVTSRAGLYQAAECFCLCDLNPDYMKHPNWQQGIMLATVSSFGVHLEPVPFFKFMGKTRALWRGKQYG